MRFPQRQRVSYILAIAIAGWCAAKAPAQPPAARNISISPQRAGVTISQPLHLTASDSAGVTWTSSGGILTNQTPTSATFTAKAAGLYTITATSKADTTKSAQATIGVTDLAGVTTWRNDRQHSGINSHEYALTPQTLSTNKFGKLFSCPVDGWIFAQPLWMPNLQINGARHNVIFVASENDSLYAFDADAPGCQPVWSTTKVNLIPADEKIASLDDLEWDSIALGPFTGITGTPVIDPVSNTIYLVAITENKTTSAIIARLHALDITTGQERPKSPVVIAASVKGTAYNTPDGVVSFAAKMQKQRASLFLLNGVIYTCWGSYFDKDPYHGWVLGYSARTLAQVTVFNDTIDGKRGGIWMGAAAPSADAQGNIYLLSGNGDFNANTGGRNYSDSLLKLSTSKGLAVTDWFTPFDQAKLAASDLDLGSGGAVLLPDQPRGPLPHLVLATAKSGMIYLLNRDHLGHYNATSNAQIVQSFMVDQNGVYSTPLFWQNTLYISANVGPVRAFRFSADTGRFQTSPASQSGQTYDYPGATPVLSSSGDKNAILWVIDPAKPGVLHAYDPSNLNTEFWNSSQAANKRDQPGRGLKFTVPTIANGKVYIGTRTELDVYGLLPN